MVSRRVPRHTGLAFADGEAAGEQWTTIHVDGQTIFLLEDEGRTRLDMTAGALLAPAELLEVSAELRSWAIAQLVPEQADQIRADRRKKRWRFMDAWP